MSTSTAAKLQPGTIAKVRLQNFLTHENLTLDFSHKYVFIHGPNGSGKSSVFQALLFVFGERLRQVRDGQTDVSELLRRTSQGSADQAAVTVYIRNGPKFNGVAPWRPDQFGDMIAVKRTIRRTGQLHGGSVTSKLYVRPAGMIDARSWQCDQTPQALLDEMLRYYRISPANRIQFLRQQDMKTFADSSPHALFMMFAEATLLTQLYSLHTSILKQLPEQIDVVQRLKVQISNLNNEIQRIRQVRRVAKQQLEYLAKERLMIQTLLVIDYRDAMIKMQNVTDEQRSRMGHLREVTQGLETARSEIERLTELSHTANTQVQASQARIQQCNEDIGQQRSSLTAKKDRITQMERPIRQMRAQLQERERDVSAAQQKILQYQAQLEILMKPLSPPDPVGPEIYSQIEYLMGQVQHFRQVALDEGADPVAAGLIVQKEELARQAADVESQLAGRRVALYELKQQADQMRERLLRRETISPFDQLPSEWRGLHTRFNFTREPVFAPVAGHVYFTVRPDLRTAVEGLKSSDRDSTESIVREIRGLINAVLIQLLSSVVTTKAAHRVNRSAFNTSAQVSGRRVTVTALDPADFGQRVAISPVPEQLRDMTGVVRMSEFLSFSPEANAPLFNFLASRANIDNSYVCTNDNVALAAAQRVQDTRLHFYSLFQRKRVSRTVTGFSFNSSIARDRRSVPQMLHNDIFTGGQDPATIQGLIATNEEQCRDHEAAISALAAQLEEVKRRQKNVDDELSAHKQAENVSEKLLNLEKALQDSIRERERLESEYAQREEEHKDAEDKQKVARNNTAERLKVAEQQLQRKTDEVEQFKAMVTRAQAEAEDQVASLRAEIDQHTQKLDVLTKELEESQRRVNENRDLITQCSRDLLERTREEKALATRCNEAQQRVDAYEPVVKQTEEACNEAREKARRGMITFIHYIVIRGGEADATVNDETSYDELSEAYAIESQLSVLNEEDAWKMLRTRISSSGSVYSKMKSVDTIARMIQCSFACSRDPTTTTTDRQVVQNRLTDLQETLHSDLEQHGSFMRLDEEYKKTKRQLGLLDTEYRGWMYILQLLCGVLEVDSILITGHCEYFKRSFESAALQSMTQFFGSDQFRGDITFHIPPLPRFPRLDELSSWQAPSGKIEDILKEGTLELRISRESDIYDTRSLRPLHTLSGGEKATVSLLLLTTAWGIARLPLVAVDEFDVFMDARRRARAVDVLLGSRMINSIG